MKHAPYGRRFYTKFRQESQKKHKCANKLDTQRAEQHPFLEIYHTVHIVHAEGLCHQHSLPQADPFV